MSVERQPERQEFCICFKIETLLSLIWVITPGLGAYSHAAFLVCRVAQCGNLFSRVVVPGAGVNSSGLARLFFSPAFLLGLVHAVFTQHLSNMFVVDVATLYRTNGLFRGHANAILTGARKRAVPTFFKAVAIVVGAYVAVYWAAFRLFDAPGEFDLSLMLLGGGAYLTGTVCIAEVCRLACAVMVLEDARGSGFGAMRWRLALIRASASKLYAAATIFALLDGVFLSLTVLTAFPSQSQSQVVAAGTAMNAVLCTVVVVTMVAQPVVYLFTATTTTHCTSKY